MICSVWILKIKTDEHKSCQNPTNNNTIPTDVFGITGITTTVSLLDKEYAFVTTALVIERKKAMEGFDGHSVIGRLYATKKWLLHVKILKSRWAWE